MNDRPDPDALDAHREQLGNEFLRIASEKPRRRVRRGLAVPVVAASLIATAGLAVAGELPLQTGSQREPLPAPVPAPAPIFGGTGSQFPDCPEEVWRPILELRDLADYPSTTGYPVPGCPTLEDLTAQPLFMTEFEATREAQRPGDLRRTQP